MILGKWKSEKDRNQGSRFPRHLLRFTMSSVSTALALVLDGIAMSAKTSTSLKKALSYRAVEILLVDNHGFQKVKLKHPLGSGADVADRHHVPEVIHEVLPKNRRSFLDEKSKEILFGTARADCQQVAEVFHDEKIPVHERQDDFNARQDLKSKHDKEFKFKKAKAKTLETINTAKMKMEHMKTEEQGKQVIEHSFGEVAITKETIKTAKLKMENEKIEEHDAHEIEFDFGVVVKDSSSQICSISEMLNNKQNLQVEHDNLIQ